MPKLGVPKPLQVPPPRPCCAGPRTRRVLVRATGPPRPRTGAVSLTNWRGFAHTGARAGQVVFGSYRIAQVSPRASSSFLWAISRRAPPREARGAPCARCLCARCVCARSLCAVRRCASPTPSSATLPSAASAPRPLPDGAPTRRRRRYRERAREAKATSQLVKCARACACQLTCARGAARRCTSPTRWPPTQRTRRAPPSRLRPAACCRSAWGAGSRDQGHVTRCRSAWGEVTGRAGRAGPRERGRAGQGAVVAVGALRGLRPQAVARATPLEPFTSPHPRPWSRSRSRPRAAGCARRRGADAGRGRQVVPVQGRQARVPPRGQRHPPRRPQRAEGSPAAPEQPPPLGPARRAAGR